jgi:hypothetical protein
MVYYYLSRDTTNKLNRKEDETMQNTTSVKVPKKYEHMIKLIEKDDEGYWAISEDGYYFGGMGAHTAHEYNQKELLAMIRTLRECDCEQCKPEEEMEEEEVVVAEEAIEEAKAFRASLELDATKGPTYRVYKGYLIDGEEFLFVVSSVREPSFRQEVERGDLVMTIGELVYETKDRNEARAMATEF